jgi:hypothetical protein
MVSIVGSSSGELAISGCAGFATVVGTIAAGTPGTSTRDLMNRMSHDSMRAALIYQHATRDADSRIADAIEQQIRQVQEDPASALARSLHEPSPSQTQEIGGGAAGPEI